MTVDALISSVLSQVRREFYAGRAREFKRDQTALMKGIARYGYECHRRGWPFEPGFIGRELADLLRSMDGKSIGYLPLYLESAVDRHIRFRAEELAEQARQIAWRVEKAMQRAGGMPVRSRPTATETLATLYQALKQRERARRAIRRAEAAGKKAQLDLL